MISYDFTDEDKLTQEVVYKSVDELAFELLMTAKNCLRRYESIALLCAGNQLVDLFGTINPELLENKNINDTTNYLVEIVDKELSRINIIDVSKKMIDPESR